MGDPKQLMKEAEECLKTSFFKWEPDHIAAASLFEQAGKVFRGRGDGESAYGAYIKAAKSHLSKGGKGYEAAAAAYQMAGQAYPEKSTEMYNKSIELYMANGSAEEALQVMSRAAETADRAGDLEAAMALYAKAVDLIQIDEYTRATVVQQFWTLMNTAFRKLIQGRKLAEASKCATKMLAIQKLRKETTPKMVLQVLIVHLARGDIGAARQLLSSSLDDAAFFRSNEGETSQLLIEAWEKLDGEAIQKLVEGNTIKYLDTQVVYLARELSPANKPAVPAGAKSSAPSSSTAADSAKASLFAPRATPTKAAPPAAQPASTPVAPSSAAAPSLPPPQPVAQPVAAQPVEPEIADDFDVPDIR